MTRTTTTKAVLCRLLAVLVMLAIAVPSVVCAGSCPRKGDARAAFLRAHHLKGVPKGFVIAHRVPLWKGGKDAASNMELISVWERGVRERREAREQAWQGSVSVRTAKSVPAPSPTAKMGIRAISRPAPVKANQGKRQAGL
jgi:hypothetical protein